MIEKSSTNLLLLGFSVIGALFVIFASGWVYSLYTNQDILQNSLIEKQEEILVNKLKYISLKRTISMLRMISKKDFFERDEEMMNLRRLGAEFSHARERLFNDTSFGLYNEEVEHWKNVVISIKATLTTQEKFLDLIMESRDKEAIETFNNLLIFQDDTRDKLHSLSKHFEEEATEGLSDVQELNLFLYYVVAVLSLISIVIGFLVIRYVISRMHRSEDALLDYGYKIRKLYNVSTESGVSAEEQINHMLMVACELFNMDHVLVIKSDEGKSGKDILFKFNKGGSLSDNNIVVIKNKLCSPFIYSSNTLFVSNTIDSKLKNGDLDDLTGINSCLSIPFIVNNNYFGVLCILDEKMRENKFNSQDCDLLKLISSWLGFAIERNMDNKRLEYLKDEAESANISKSEFLGNMSHELRTPMHAILSYSGFGVKRFDTANDEKKLSYFKKIDKSAKTLLQLLDDILDLSKLEANKMEFIFKLNNLNENIKDVVDEFKAMAAELNVILTCEFEVEEHEIIFDAVRIKQVIRNLISNAIKFSNSGGIVKLKTSTNMNGILFSTIDEGLGIPESELQDVFTKFKQSSKTNTGAGGTGLGLTICREIISSHKGKIWAEKNNPEGTVLNVWIPLDPEYSETKKVS